MADRYPYYTEMAPGCHGEPFAPVVSRHTTWNAALNAASKSDRLVAVAPGQRAQIPRQDDPRYGTGRFGNGLSGKERTEWILKNGGTPRRRGTKRYTYGRD
jgi:hypothetical protein